VVTIVPEIAAAALDHVWADPACAVPLREEQEEQPDRICEAIAGELDRRASATTDQVLDVVHDVLAVGYAQFLHP
jgi:hypothetical protein